MSFVVKVRKNSKPPSPEAKTDLKPEPSKKDSSPLGKIKEELEKIEKKLEKIPLLVSLSKTYKHKKCTIASVFIGAGLFAFLIIYDIYAAFLVDLLSYFYPAYQSMKSVEKGEKGHYKQWLSYWVILNFPYYYLLKGMMIIWLMVPHVNGADWTFNSIMKLYIPFMDKIAKTIDKREEKKEPEEKKDKPDAGPKVDKADSKEGGKHDSKLTKSDSKLSKSDSKRSIFRYSYVS